MLWLHNLLLSKQQSEQVFTQNQDVLLYQQVKFKNWYMIVLSHYHKFESYKINIYSALLYSPQRIRGLTLIGILAEGEGRGGGA